jgi:DNA-binding LacI/PurR family transcriptional regulator
MKRAAAPSAPVRKTAKHGFIVNSLRQEIVRGRLGAGAQLPPNTDLAAQFGVSVVTIQSALNRLAREGFIQARPRKGTFVTEKLPHLTNYALVFWNDPQSPLTWSKYYMALTSAALFIEREEHRNLTLFHGIDQHVDSEDRQRLLAQVQAHRLAGMIFANTPMYLVGTSLLDEPGIPRVALMGEQLYAQVPIVSFDGFLPRALDYLRERGRARIAIVGIESYLDHTTELERLLHERALHVPSYWRQYVSKMRPDSAAHCVELLMHGPPGERPDGLIITDDNLVEHGLAGLVAAAVRVPDDVEVVAHCNFPWPAASVLPVKRLGFDI